MTANKDQSLIHVQMNKIQAAADGLVKEQQNEQQGFMYRGVDDAYNYLHDIFAKNGVFTVPRVTSVAREERLSARGKTLIFTLLTIEYDFFAADGSFITASVIGEALDLGDKSCNKAMSVAHKMALFQVTMLPTMLSADTDSESHELMPNIPEEKPAAETPMAVRDQLAELSDFRAEHKTTMEENDYLDNQGSRLTYKQACQMIDRLKAREEK